MDKNMGKIDRVGRLALAAALLALAFGTGALGNGVIFWLAVIFAGVFALTAILGNCPLYRIVGFKSCQDCQ